VVVLMVTTVEAYGYVGWAFNNAGGVPALSALTLLWGSGALIV
jgi:hypothetical protein